MAPLVLDGATLGQLVASFLWPFFRIGALFSVLPVLGGGEVPVRVRVGLALVLTALVLPILPPAPSVRSAVGGGGVDHRAGDRHRGGDGTRRARRVQRRDARRREHRGHDGTRLRADERSAERRLGADRQPVLPDPRDPPVRDPRRAPRGARARRVELHDACRSARRSGRTRRGGLLEWGGIMFTGAPRHRAALASRRC